MIYTIKKGNHFANWWWIRWLWSLHYGDTISYKVRFNKNCDQPYMSQWNKLFGFSIGLNSMKHNARFVFDFFQEDFDAYIKLTSFIHSDYQHDGAEQDWHFITNLDLEVDYNLTITKENVSGKTTLHFYDALHQYSIQTEIPYSKWGWKLYPFIGGVYPAKQDTTIELISA